VFWRASRVGFVLAMALMVWSGTLLTPEGASASAVYYSVDTAQRMLPFSIGADGSLSPIACSGSNCATSDDPNGEAVTPNGRFLYVSGYSGTISAFAIGADGSLTPIPCSSACNLGDGTLQLAISPDGRFVYAPIGASGVIAVLAIGADGSLARVPCSASNCSTAPGLFPISPVVTPDGKSLYVADRQSGLSAPGAVSIFAIASDGTLTPVSCAGDNCAAGEGASDASLTPDGRFLYVANDFANTVSPYAIGSDGTLTPIACAGSSCNTGFGPSVIAVSPNGQFVYAANTDGTVSVFAIGSDGSLTPVPCSTCSNPSAPAFLSLAISPGARFLYTATGLGNGLGTLSVFAMASDGTLSPVSCSACSTGGQSNNQALVASPDQAPVAAFTAASAPPGSATTFNATGSSASPGQTVARYDWTFGDGTSATNAGPTPTHTYASVAHYTVTLTVTDDAGCSTTLVFTGQTASCNGGPAAQKSATITVASPPTATITTPANGATYAQGQAVSSSFNCKDGAGGPGISSCLDHNGRGSGAAVDTATSGTHAFRVTAMSADGQSSTSTVSYTVATGPAATISSPVNGRRYKFGKIVIANYSCQDASSGPGIASCTGTVPEGTHIDTTKAGNHTFAVTATSKDGQSTTARAKYTVLPDNHFTVSHIKTNRSGTISFKVNVPGAGVINALGTAWIDNIAQSSVLLQAARNRFVYGRSHKSSRRKVTIRMRLSPNSRGRRLVEHHTYAVTLRLWVTYKPAGGQQSKLGFRALHLPH
jgi:6-phosphogluconolactonase (cycloisomerase 2 family)